MLNWSYPLLCYEQLWPEQKFGHPTKSTLSNTPLTGHYKSNYLHFLEYFMVYFEVYFESFFCCFLFFTVCMTFTF